MFSIFLSFILFLVLIAAGDIIVKEGDFTIDTDVLFVNSTSNRVGIGTAIPTALLDVGGGILTSINGVGDLLVSDDIEADGTIYAEISVQAPMLLPIADPDTGVIFPAADQLQLFAGTHEILDYQEDGSSTLQINDGDQADISFHTTDLFIGGSEGSYDGNVGIGTSTPESIFQISHTGALTTRFYAGATSDVNFIFGQDTSTERFLIGYDDSPDGFRIYDYGGTPGTRLFVETSTGYVGIGDTTPSEKLDIAGNVRADDFIEYSDIFKGDALNVIKSMESTGGTGDWQELNHTSLIHVEGLIKTYLEPIYEIGNQTIEESTIIGNRTIYGRSVNKMMDINTRAIEQLLERIEFLENELCNFESYSWC
ncbi:hypothetical protein HQ529_04680 [Candidatus Woesearchaeota archaeon]|nr:hypothetical protein [Candidatus Woesearchaeota archaeon]